MTNEAYGEAEIRRLAQEILSGLVGSGGGGQAAGTVPVPNAPVPAPLISAPGGVGEVASSGSADYDAPQSAEQALLVPNPANRAAYLDMMRSTPARIGGWRAGPRPRHESLLRFRADHAAAMDAVFNDVPDELVAGLGLFAVQSAAADRAAFLMDPNIGAKLSAEESKRLSDNCPHGVQVQVIVADGLSSTAVDQNVPDLLPALSQGLARHGLSSGTGVFVKYGRVRVMDEVSAVLGSEVTLILIGERPGLVTNESLSCYMAYHAYPGMPENVRTVVSNIYRKGTPPSEAGAYIAEIARKMIDAKSSGMDLKL